MTIVKNTTTALRRAVGRFWTHLAESAAPARRPLTEDKWSDYPRFPWF